MTVMHNGKQYKFDAGYSELVIFDSDNGGVSITLQSKARGYDDYHNQQCQGNLSAEELVKVVNRLSPKHPDPTRLAELLVEGLAEMCSVTDVTREQMLAEVEYALDAKESER